MTTLFPREATFTDIKKPWQGRSKKQLRPVITHDGRVWVARYEGRAGRFFGASMKEVQNNLQAGGA